ncbi:P2 family phage contractile tail tube protein [Azospirillum fermentarium]|uniref:phage major tail tube protein n=1 Tax=Azospirillum fermentarium TaxID=1233114 RepID=UPI0022279595|nr:phage major tail tube protein [Azospirillum fermentarium]MCW2248678.1 P2 family phage contractile tail tube protein [Azospirillum fermentarium]
MSVQVNKVYNANVYLDGTLNLIGRASEVALPDLALNLEGHKALGMFGEIQIPTRLNAMKCTIKWTGFYAEHLRAGANPFKAHNLQVRSSLETWTAQGRTREVPVVWHMTASWNTVKLGTLKAGDVADFGGDELRVTQVKVLHDGATVCEIDVFNNIWNVNGEDILARSRANMGI